MTDNISIREETLEQKRYHANCPHCGDEIITHSRDSIRERAKNHCEDAIMEAYLSEFKEENGFPFYFLILDHAYKAFEGEVDESHLGIFIESVGYEQFKEYESMYEDGILTEVHRIVESWREEDSMASR